MADTEAEKTSAAEIVGSIDDLLLEIIRRVPSENIDRNKPRFLFASKHLKILASEYCSRIRLRLVSRHWNSLISSNFFLAKPFPAAGLIFQDGPTSSKHTSTTTAHSSYIIYLDKSISTAILPCRNINPANDPWHSRHSKVVHSCNGLLLCASKWDYSVCNRTTGKHSTLPQVPPADINNKIIRGVCLAFDPCKSPHYKVVCVLGLEYDSQFVVFSSETGCWGKRGELLIKTKNDGFSFPNNNMVYWNGAIHWVSSSKLICFNLDDRLASPKVIPLPIIARNHERYYFGESYGHLHYIGLDDGTRELVVHEMSSDYSGWIVKFKFDVSNAVRRSILYLNSYYDDFNVYAVVRGERSEDTFLVLGTSWGRGSKRKIVRLNHDDTFEIIYDFNDYYNFLNSPEELDHPFQYIESLACV